MRDASRRAAGRPVHAFGDMVGVLWQRQQRDLAVALERLWNDLQLTLPFSLFCAYPVDVFGDDFCAQALGGVFETHTHVDSGGASLELGRALDRAMSDVLGSSALHVRSLTDRAADQTWPCMPQLERLILWLRSNMPETAPAIFRRAREHYDEAMPRLYLRKEGSARIS